mgnify:CR=1 FL=1
MLERREPAGYWQSVTGSLHPGEAPVAAARVTEYSQSLEELEQEIEVWLDELEARSG